MKGTKVSFSASRLAAPAMLSVALSAFMLPPVHAAPAAPAAPALRLSARGAFDVPSARAGDTVRYRLRVEWREVPAAVMLLPREELETPGFLPAGSSTVHRKSSGDGSPDGALNVTEYTYALVAREAGTGRVAPFALRYHNGLTGREEAVGVPGALLEITPAPRPLAQRPAVRILAALLLVLIAAAALAALWRRRLKRLKNRRLAPPSPAGETDPFAAGIEMLQRRCDAADSRLWLAEAERLCTQFLCGRLGVSHPGNVRFEAVLEAWRARRPGMPPGEADGWTTLRDLFHEARYAGGRREPHVLRDACRHLKNCLRNEETYHE
jgi:hypothetical protein